MSSPEAIGVALDALPQNWKRVPQATRVIGDFRRDCKEFGEWTPARGFRFRSRSLREALLSDLLAGGLLSQGFTRASLRDALLFPDLPDRVLELIVTDARVQPVLKRLRHELAGILSTDSAMTPEHESILRNGVALLAKIDERSPGPWPSGVSLKNADLSRFVLRS